jgi:hypothetical protein
MPRHTSLALAITLALAAAGCTSSVSTSAVSEKTLYQEQALPIRDTSQNADMQDLLKKLCEPIPFWPWCI